MKKSILLLSAFLLLNVLFVAAQMQQQTVTLQPSGSDCAKSALLASCTACGYDNTNYATSGELDAAAGSNDNNPSDLRSLMQFDLTAIPAGSTVQSATLSLYFDPSSSNGQDRQDPGPNDAYIKQVTAPWDAGVVTWDNQPSTTSTNEAYLPASTSATEDYTGIDVTAMMQGFVNNPDLNYGMMLQLATETEYKDLIFASGYNVDPTLHPKLVIIYTPPVPTGCVSLQYASCNGTDAIIASCTACGYADRNFANSEEIDATAGTNQNNISDIRGLIYWDLSSIPSTAIVTSANLSLYFDPTSSNGQDLQQSGSNDAYLNKVTSSWDESTVTWNNQPSTTTIGQVHLSASTSSTEDYTNIDVMSLVQDMVTNPSNNYGLMLQLATESGYRDLIFASSDYPDPGKHPKLDICYSLNAGVNNIQAENPLAVAEDYNTETVTIKSQSGFEPGTTFLLYNSIGQLVGQWENLSGTISVINKPNVSDGVYFYSLFSKSETLNGKLIF